MSDVILLQQLSEAEARVQEAKVLAGNNPLTEQDLDTIANRVKLAQTALAKVGERTTHLKS